MKKEYKDTEEYKILDELIAQYIDEDTNSNELAWAMGYDKPLTEEQIQASMISMKYKGGN